MKKIFSLGWIKFTLLLSLIFIMAAITAPMAPRVSPDRAGRTGQSCPSAAEITGHDLVSARTALADTHDVNPDYAAPASATTIETFETIANVEDDPIVHDSEAAQIGGLWVDGRRVPMTAGQLDEFETKLYQCKTIDEYTALMETVAYYNKGVDMSRFPWYWDEMGDYYSDEQIAMLQTGTRQWKTVPDIVGMEIREAYETMTKLGFLVRFYYYYCPDSTLPVGYCYYQDIEPGTRFNTDAGIMVNVQAPTDITRSAILWDPDDENFDIYEIAREIRETGYLLRMPRVEQKTVDDAVYTLESMGFKHVIVVEQYIDQCVDAGFCYLQEFEQGTEVLNLTEIRIYIQAPIGPFEVPNVVGLSMAEAIEALRNTGLIPYVHRVNEPESGIPADCCVRQQYEPGTWTSNNSVKIYIQESAPISPLPEPSPQITLEPTPEPSPEITPEATPEPTATETTTISETNP